MTRYGLGRLGKKVQRNVQDMMAVLLPIQCHTSLNDFVALVMHVLVMD